ncbi:HAD family phosphatase [Pelagicoccus sp. SDUM812003]|uniref:HAD family hydrolase n=1 Tax=Pelagicoccus sp. SDUM812003 TaxID=3041267 RepID=UPI00280C477F|nr:HAD family phosphatase [Pelagicoccus sp. SDUM812003]MDQ8205410.1 HAD family phosphatase [Pelagicoccus sp. SDUM812003]
MGTEFGFIFDWDGVVVDSSRQHELSWDRLAEVEELALYPGHFKDGFGKKNSFIIPNLLKWTDDPQEIERLSLRKEEFYREIVAETGLSPLPGVASFLKELKAAGFRACVGSSTPRRNIDAVTSLIGLEGRFDDVVSADDVGNGKPDPEVFLKAAAKIGVEPSRCVVFEDSFSGIEAGQRAGMKVVGLATTNPIESLREHGVSLAASSFEELNLQVVHDLFA